ncbi:MAG: 30S ribosomal protein S15 [Candidatus Aenigmatarchaeota archaeon]
MVKKSLKNKKPEWLTYTPEEVEQIVLKLFSEKKTAAKIGLILRDQYGIPSAKAVTGKTMTMILKGKMKEIPEDLFDLLKRAVNIHRHLGTNKQDAHGRRGLEKTESKVRSLVKYYIKMKKLPADWKYDAEKAKLLVQE